MKQCPVCGNEDWDYDVVSGVWFTYCGDCFTEVNKYGHEHGLTTYKLGGGFIFKSVKDLFTALAAVTRI